MKEEKGSKETQRTNKKGKRKGMETVCMYIDVHMYVYVFMYTYV